MLHVARFLLSYVRNDPGPHEREVELTVGDSQVPATLIRSSGRASPAWVVLHGITVPGRQHPTLVRFAHALAAAGGTVIIPEVPAWRELRIDPAAAEATIIASANYLQNEVGARSVGVIGFSFGATQALVTAASLESRELIDTVVGFGGYYDLERTLVFMMTGEHEWRGTQRVVEPDPYGRWIVAANYLAGIPEYADFPGVVAGARLLAEEVGRNGAFAGDPIFDPLKARIRNDLTPPERDVWDLIAHPAGAKVDRDAARSLARKLVEVARRVHPALEPAHALPAVTQRVVLAHGFEDRLVPFTESLRLHEALPAQIDSSITITRLFAHSTGGDALRPWQYPTEVARYVRLLTRALTRRQGSR